MRVAYGLSQRSSASPGGIRRAREAEEAISSDIQVQSFVNSETARPGDTITLPALYNGLAIPVYNVQIKDTSAKAEV